ncbi:Os01g0706200, partial [Oryza sativa Japonica Group]
VSFSRINDKDGDSAAASDGHRGRLAPASGRVPETVAHSRRGGKAILLGCRVQ